MILIVLEVDAGCLKFTLRNPSKKGRPLQDDHPKVCRSVYGSFVNLRIAQRGVEMESRFGQPALGVVVVSPIGNMESSVILTINRRDYGVVWGDL